MDIDMVLLQCAECGMPFAITSDRMQRLQECHNDFYCPMGHVQAFLGKSEVERLRDQLQRKEDELKSIMKMNEQLRKSKRKQIKKKVVAKSH